MFGDTVMFPVARFYGSAGASADEAKTGESALRGLCKEFEAIFISQILETARVFENPEGSGLGVSLPDTSGELARALAEKGCLGLADVLEARLSGR